MISYVDTWRTTELSVSWTNVQIVHFGLLQIGALRLAKSEGNTVDPATFDVL